MERVVEQYLVRARDERRDAVMKDDARPARGRLDPASQLGGEVLGTQNEQELQRTQDRLARVDVRSQPCQVLGQIDGMASWRWLGNQQDDEQGPSTGHASRHCRETTSSLARIQPVAAPACHGVNRRRASQRELRWPRRSSTIAE
jgi:hypothetical protein